MLSTARQRPVCHRSFLCASAAATAVINAARSAASQRTPRRRGHRRTFAADTDQPVKHFNWRSNSILLPDGAVRISLGSMERNDIISISHWFGEEERKSFDFCIATCRFQFFFIGILNITYYEYNINDRSHHQRIPQPASPGLLHTVV